MTREEIGYHLALCAAAGLFGLSCAAWLACEAAAASIGVARFAGELAQNAYRARWWCS